MGKPVEPEAIKRALAVRMLDLARELLPDGKLEGMEWRGHGPDGSAWGVVIRGSKTGSYQNFGAGTGGMSGLGLVRDLACGGDFKAAYRWALDFLGEDQTAWQAAPRLPPEPAAVKDGGKALYLHGKPFDWAGPVGLYLQGRGIDPAKFARPPRALRFHSGCWHSDERAFLPAMLAPIIHAETREHIATHRTYLERDGAAWRKARIGRAKKVMGSTTGGVIPLTRGSSGKPLAEAKEGEGCLIAEGIENALTVAQWFPELRALAAVSAGNLPTIRLPAALDRVMLVRDRDGNNLAVMGSRNAAIAAWQAEGRECREWLPPEGLKDANEAAKLGGDDAA